MCMNIQIPTPTQMCTCIHKYTHHMCMYTDTCTYTDICIYTQIYTPLSVYHMHTNCEVICIYTDTYTYTDICIYTQIYTPSCACTHRCLHIHKHIHIFINIHTTQCIMMVGPDILECEGKWALGSITRKKASGGDGIPVELFQVLKDVAANALHSICQQIWKIQQWPQY